MPGSSMIKEFLVGLGFDIDDASYGEFTNGIAAATKKVALLGAAVKAAAALIFRNVLKTAEGLDELGDISERIGTPVKDIEKLGYIASQTGSSQEALRASLENVAKAAGEATIGVGRGKEAFEKLGIKAKDSKGKLKDSAVLLGEIGEKIKKLDKGAQIAFVERLGVDRTLIQTITGDVSALSDEFEKMYDAAGINANEAAAAAGEFMDEWGKLKEISRQLYRAINVGFMLKFKDDIIRLRKMIMENAASIKRFVSGIMTVITRMASAIGAAAMRIIGWIVKIANWFDQLDDDIKRTIVIVAALIAAWKLLNLQFLATPLGALIASFAALFLIVDDLLTYLEGGDSYINWSKWEKEIKTAAKWFEWLKDRIAKTWKSIQSGIRQVKKWFSDLWETIGRANVIQKVIDWWGRLNDSAKTLVTVIGALGAAWAAFSLIMAVSPIGAVIAAIGALLFLIGDLMDFLDGKDTVIDWGPWEKQIRTIFETLKTLGGVIVDIFSIVGPIAIDIFTEALNGIANVIGFVIDVIMSLLPAVSTVFGGIIGVVKSLWDLLVALGNWIKAIFTGDIQGAADAGQQAFGAFFNFIKSGFQVLSGIVSGFFTLVGKVIGKVKDLLGLSSQTSNIKVGASGGESAVQNPAFTIPGTPNLAAAMAGPATNISNMHGARLSPSPAQQGEMRQTITNTQENKIDSQTTINVYGQSDPNATANAVAKKQEGVARNTSNAISPFRPKK